MDHFGIGEKPWLKPVQFEKLMGGRPCASDSVLLRLPKPLLTDIAEFLSDNKPSLASLALTNSDCRQLARSCQFANVVFSHREYNHGLVVHLAHESFSDDDGTPRIRHCVRSIQFGMELSPYVYQSDVFLAQGLESILAHFWSHLPHLTSITWHGQLSTSRHLAHAIANTAIQHLHITNIFVDHNWLFKIPDMPHLRSLKLSLDTYHFPSPLASLFFEMLLKACAASLESLEWRRPKSSPQFTDIVDWPMHLRAQANRLGLRDGPIHFPRLRWLMLEGLIVRPTLMHSFLGARLKHLTVPLCPDPTVMPRLLAGCDTMRDLETLSMPLLATEHDAELALDFVARHSSSLKFLCLQGMAGAVMDGVVIPRLVEAGLPNLISLSLEWWTAEADLDDPVSAFDICSNWWGSEVLPRGITPPPRWTLWTLIRPVYVPERSLALIGKLDTLRQLRLFAGGRECRDPAWWMVDHRAMCALLSGLTKLHTLAICGDDYGDSVAYNVWRDTRWWGVGPNDFEDWAEEDIDDGLVHDDDDDDDAWPYEYVFHYVDHRSCMLNWAGNFAAALPSLEWMFCGSTPMGVEPPDEEGFRCVSALIEGMDRCETQLRQWFTMDVGAGAGRQ